MSDIEKLERDIVAKIGSADTAAALEEVRVAALGKKGAVSERMKTLGKMSPEERKEMGPALNGLKDRIPAAIEAKKAELEEAALVVVVGHPQHGGTDAQLEPFDGVVDALDAALLGAAHVVLRGAEDLGEELLLGVEVPVEDALADAEAVDEFGDRGRVLPVGGEARRGELDQLGGHGLAPLSLRGVGGVRGDLYHRIGRLHQERLRRGIVAVLIRGEAPFFQAFEGVVRNGHAEVLTPFM